MHRRAVRGAARRAGQSCQRVYTPGDNEWTDCHTEGRDPLDRLASLRRIFFADADRTLGRTPLTVVSQAGDPEYPEFVENTRWTVGGFVFATIHLVGSRNGTRPFEGRTARHDEEVERRTAAAVAWLDEAFDAAARTGAKGVVLAVHTNLWTDPGLSPREEHRAFVERLAAQVSGFDRPVLLVHGDTHDQRVDRPLVDASGRPYANFTRLETFGSPRIGWVRVVIDTIAGRFARYEPRLVRGW